MTSEFETATAVTRTGPTTFAGEVVPGWDITGVPNGGYVLAFPVRAMLASVSKPDPVSVTAHYLRPAQVGPLEVEVNTARDGRTLATANAVLRQGGKELIRVIGTFADLEALDGPELVTGTPPDLPPPDECPETQPSKDGSGFPPPFAAKVRQRVRPDQTAFARGESTGVAEISGYLGLADGTDADVVALCMFADSYPPPIFNAGIGPGWVPTVELTVHVRRRPAPGLVAGVFRTRFVQGGMLEDEGELWDSTGHLVAQFRQLALAPRTG